MSNVGTGRALQVPSLLGVSHRAPFMHNGCAPTLRDRFGACGGGDRHGNTSHLSEPEINDLGAYLESL
jgi:cytochrome c peroxidase